MTQSEVQRLSATHRQTGNGAVLPVGIYAEVLLDVRNQTADEVFVEIAEGPERTHTTGTRVILLCASVRHHHNHVGHLPVGIEVVHDDVRHTAILIPFVLVATNAMQQVEHAVLLLGIILRRQIDVCLTGCTYRFRLVLNEFHRTFCNSCTLLVETLRSRLVLIEFHIDVLPIAKHRDVRLLRISGHQRDGEQCS